mmetsp:Transcript_65901/g.162221  ORF Transcript_65901/g.162221 Transcript_65901/m.162221 type:complete len:194 (+) Transcript_65901:59-640(+)
MLRGTSRLAATTLKAAAPRFMSAVPPTPDLCDKANLDVSKLATESKIKIVDPAMNFKNFGGKIAFHGPVSTIKAYESNPTVRKAFEEPGEGRVLVVDAGGSLRCAMLGDMIAEFGVKNGWAGIIMYGCIRDSKAIAEMPIGVKALNTHPVKSHKKDPGLRDVPVMFGGVTFKPGQFVYADEDGIVVSDSPMET